MIKSILFLVLLFFFVPTVLFSQNECSTPAPPPPSWIFNPSLKVQSTQTTQERSYMLRIFIHIIRKTDGSGGVGAGALTAIPNVLNSAFSNTGIQFHLSGHEYINSDKFYIELTNAEESELFLTNAHSDAIDIYVLGSSTNFGSAGSAQTIPSTAMIVHGSYYSQSTLPHEMGHCLGLYHTHHGTHEELDRDGSNPDPNQCAELVNRSNSTTCGDYIADTPADPYKWSANSCSYVGSGVDVNSQRYNPDPSNIMSYAYKPCRNKFTPLQIQRMLDFIANTTALQNTIIPHISDGSTTVCSGTSATFTIQNWQNNQPIQWIPGPYLTRSGTSTNPATFTANGSGASWVDAKVNGEQLTRYNLWVGLPSKADIYYYGSSPIGISTLTNANAISNGADNFDWSILYGTFYNPPLQGSPNGSTINFITGTVCPGGTTLSVRGINCCGSGANGTLYIPFSCKPGDKPKPPSIDPSSMAYPNPASNILNVDIDQLIISQTQALEQTTTKQLKTDPTYDIRLYDYQGNLLRQKFTKGGTVQFNVANLANGIYYLHIYDGVNEKPEMRQIVVEH